MAQFSVISPQFIAPEQLEIILEKYPCRTLVITDHNHKIMLKVKQCDTTFHCQRVLVDSNDRPIAMLRQKNMSMHSRWNVFKGESKSDSDMIFSAKRERVLFQLWADICVMFGNQTSDDCGLKIKGDWSKGKCDVYLSDSKIIVAQMKRVQTSLKKTKSSDEKFIVTIQPNIDYAFIVALLAIFDAMENPDEVKKSSGGAAGAAFNILDIAGAFASN